MDPNLATIKLSVDHNKLRLVRNIDATTMAIGAIQVVFDFPEQSEWQNLQKTAVFIRGTDNRAQILDSDNSCIIPWETLNVTDKHGDIVYDVGVFGTANGIRIPTNKVRLTMKEGCYIQGQSSITPTPTVYEQIISMIQGLNDYDETKIKGFVAEYLSDNDYATETYVDQKISEIPAPDVSGQINTHNTSTTAHADLFAKKADRIDGTIISNNADYAEILQWYDNNPNAENRIGRFVMLDADTPGRTIKIASQNSDVIGVTVDSPAFSGNAANKFDSSGNLLTQYEFVAVHGIVPIIDNGTCTVKGRCMPNSDGTAIPSTNNMGYFCMERVDATHMLIVVEPNADMLKHIKDDIVSLESGKQDKLIAGENIVIAADGKTISVLNDYSDYFSIVNNKFCMICEEGE